VHRFLGRISPAPSGSFFFRQNKSHFSCFKNFGHLKKPMEGGGGSIDDLRFRKGDGIDFTITAQGLYNRVIWQWHSLRGLIERRSEHSDPGPWSIDSTSIPVRGPGIYYDYTDQMIDLVCRRLTKDGYDFSVSREHQAYCKKRGNCTEESEPCTDYLRIKLYSEFK
jgi:hypothetical protein